MGYASVVDDYDFKLKDDFLKLEYSAIKRKAGLWRDVKEKKIAAVNNVSVAKDSTEVSKINASGKSEGKGMNIEKLLNASGFDFSKLGISARDIKNAMEGMGYDTNINPEKLKKLQKGKSGKNSSSNVGVIRMFDMINGGAKEKSDALDVVYVNPGENIYHRAGCKFIKKGAKAMLKIHAKLSMKPCPVCNSK